MKRYVFLIVGMSSVFCSAQPPERDIVLANANSSTPLLARDDRALQRHAFMATMRDHSIDVAIASLYFVGSGFPGVSDEFSWQANALASALWIADSAVRMVVVCRKRSAAKRVAGHVLREIVVDP
jgi:hypothetical protein